MTATPTFRDRIAALEHLARARGEADFADLLNAYRFALSEEAWNGDECLAHAEEMQAAADKLYQRFDSASGWLKQNEREDVS
jgi:hypothetical protein